MTVVVVVVLLLLLLSLLLALLLQLSCRWRDARYREMQPQAKTNFAWCFCPRQIPGQARLYIALCLQVARIVAWHQLPEIDTNFGAEPEIHSAEPIRSIFVKPLSNGEIASAEF